MENQYSRPVHLILSVLLIGFCISTNAQHPHWRNFLDGHTVNDMAQEGNFIWACTEGGVVKINRSTGARVFYDHANSGLPGNRVCGVAIDPSGVKWFLVWEHGLVRFDNNTWTEYNLSNSGLPDGHVYSIVIDHSGNKWIGTWNGLAKFNNSTWTVYNASNSGMPSNEAIALAVDSANAIWVGTYYAGLAKFNGTSWTVYNQSNSGLPCPNITSIAIDTAGNKWIGLTYCGVARFTGTTWTSFTQYNSLLPNNVVYTVSAEPNGTVWIGTADGLVKYAGNAMSVYDTSNSALAGNSIAAILTDTDGGRWVSNSDGYSATTATNVNAHLTRFDTATWLNYATSPTCLTANRITCTTTDRMNNTWIGTYGAGIARFDGRNWTNYNSSNSGLPMDEVESVATDHANNVWVGTNGAGLAKYNGVTWTVFNSWNSGLASDQVMNICIDRFNNKWISTLNGLIKFDDVTWTAYQPGNSGIPCSSILCVAIDTNDVKWIGTNCTYGGLVKFDGSSWTVYHSAGQGPNIGWIASIATDSRNNKWFGNPQGLIKFDDQNWTVYNNSNSGLPTAGAGYVTADRLNNLWIASTWLTKFNGSTWTSYNANNSGLTANTVGNIHADRYGAVWAGNDYGLSYFNDHVPVDISGMVYNSSGTLLSSGQAFFYDISDYTGGYDTLASVPVINGHYQLHIDTNYMFKIQVVPDGGGLPAMMPAYATDTILWKGGDTLVGADSVHVRALHLPACPAAMTGTKTIRGKARSRLYNPQGNSPVANVGVALRKKGSAALTGFARTDMNGEFLFSHADTGSYYLFLDYPGIPMYTHDEANLIHVDSQADTAKVTGFINPSYIAIQRAHSYLTKISAAICHGDSLFVQGAYRKVSGIYHDTLASLLACDSIIETTLAVLPLPVVNLGHDTLIGEMAHITLDAGPTMKSYLWSDSSTRSSLTVYGAAFTSLTQMTFVKVTDSSNCSNSDTILISVPALGNHITGYVNYNNRFNTNMQDVHVYINQNNIKIDSTLSDWNGHFQFPDHAPGPYGVSMATTIPWGGVNGTDAIDVLRYIAHLSMLTSQIRDTASDVNKTYGTNATDALLIKLRYVGIVNSFARGDWLFRKVSGGDTLNLGTYSIIRKFYGLCVGDVNGSYVFGNQ